MLRLGEFSMANDRNECAVHLHLREALREDAQDCGRATTVQDIFEVLRTGFGTSPRKLGGTWLPSERRSEIPHRSMPLKYNELPEDCHHRMSIDIFSQ